MNTTSGYFATFARMIRGSGRSPNSSLTQTPSLVTITDVALAAGTYWIGTETSLLPTSIDDPVNGTYGSGQWWWTNTDPSVPETLNFNSIGGEGPFAVGGVAKPGAYELIVEATVATPDTTTIAVLGGGLAGLGYFRRRKPKAV